MSPANDSPTAPVPEKEEEGGGRKLDIPLWAVLLTGLLFMGASFATVFFIVGGGFAGQRNFVRSEEWEYWGGKFHFRISYNTSEPVIATKNSVQVGRGCTLQINSSTATFNNFRDKVNALMKLNGDIVIQNATKIGSDTAEIQTALSKIYAYYCQGRFFAVTSGKYCRFDILTSACE